MDLKTKQEMALFRFALVAPVINNTYSTNSKMEYFREVSRAMHKLPTGKMVKYSSLTIKKWYLQYNNGGLDALEPKTRNDAGIPRTLTNEVIDKIHRIRDQFPYITGKLMYHKLIEEGYLSKQKSSLSSILRYLRDNNLKSSQITHEETKAFQMELANTCWQADSSTGPRIKINGKSKKTYLISIIDDKSRMITHSEFFFNDNAVNVQMVLKKAISKYGVPKMFYVDNGTPYKNSQLSLICASLGISLIHCTPYSPNKKGKIERFFRTIKDNWMNGIDWNIFDSLQSLNKNFNIFLNENYSNKIHSSIDETPRNSFERDCHKIKFIPSESLDEHFLHKISRRVYSDATIKINNVFFEVPQKFIGQRINIKYDPCKPEVGYIIDDKNTIICEITLLNRVDNSKIKRNKIDYKKHTED